MNNYFLKNTVFLWLCICFSCVNHAKDKTRTNESPQTTIGTITIDDIDPDFLPAANNLEAWTHYIDDKKIGLVANQTTVVADGMGGYKHLADVLLEKKFDLVKVFAPEHGFRGTADAGEIVKDGVDIKTGLPIISLYGSNKKPTKEQIKDLDILIFDIQDVGARFYTYISTLHYVMQAAAENDIKVLVLDRPNPNIQMVDGPVLEEAHTSFIGMHKIPVVHGMTIAEYASMVNREGWLGNGLYCDLQVVIMDGYDRTTSYDLPIKPSPNLPNEQAINLYPSTCFFEGTILSEGRGTDLQFQIFGSPKLPKNKYTFQFTPVENEGSKHPKFKNTLCYGKDLSQEPKLDKLNLEWLIQAYQDYPKKEEFFTNFFTLLAGTKKLQKQIEQGWTAQKIRDSWQTDLNEFKLIREKYLLYD
ncbi:MAG TPA: DUF1343 domain-containing protein [Flavobacteriaceae bacterium]|nr:DUF1343 domain-containing protein [Flavobacteriaceae bacterium]